MQLASSKSYIRPFVLIKHGDSALMLRSVRNSILSRCGANMVGQSRYYKEQTKVAMMDLSRLFFAVNAINFDKGGDVFFRPWPKRFKSTAWKDTRGERPSLRNRKLTFQDLYHG